MKNVNLNECRHHHRKVLAIILILSMAVALVGLDESQALAQGAVRSWGMGGTGVANSRGLDAVDYNPANLAFSRGFSMGLVTAAVDVHNNAISLDRYNEITGAHLTTGDKEQLLNDIPEDGFRLDADMRASVLGVHSGSLALTFNAIGAGSGNLDKDYFDLVLFGNQLGETVDFTNTNGEGYAVGQAALSYGQVLHTGKRARLSYGLSAKYLQGIYEMHVEEAHGSMHTSLEAISGEAFVSTLSAEGGRGYGLDFGLAMQTSGGWSLGASVENIYSTMTWNQNVEAREFRAHAGDVNVLNDDLDNAVVNSDTTFASTNYNTTLPPQLRMGVSNRFGPVSLALDYTQGFEDRGMSSTTPRFHLGGEFFSGGFLQPRFGLSTGGDSGTGASAGLGLRLGFWKVDLAVLSRGELNPNKTKGVAFAAGSSLEF